MAVAVVVAWTRPAIYESSTLVYIDPKFDQLLRFETVEGGGASDLDSLSSLQIMMTADTMILRVVDRLDLREEEGFLPQRLAEKSQLPDQQLANFLRQERFSAELVEETRLIKIKVRDPDPERAQRIAEVFAEEFDEFLVERRQEEARRSHELLTGQLADARDKAMENEKALREFRESHPQYPVEQDHDMFAARLTKFSDELNAVESQRMELGTQVEYLAEIDPETRPLVVFKVAGSESDRYVSDLMRLRAASVARLANADETMHSSERGYLAIKGEFESNEQLLRETAVQMKMAVESKFGATKAREAALRIQLGEVKAQLVAVKSLSSEFRVVHQQAERSWLTVDNLQNRLGESDVAMGSQGNIATEVSQALKPYKKAGSGALLFIAVGGCVGMMLSLGWLAVRILIGVPYTHGSQLEKRFGVPLLADWKLDAGRSQELDPLLMHSFGGSRVIQISAPGAPGLCERVAELLAEMSAGAKSRTLLLTLNSTEACGGNGYMPRSIGRSGLVRLEVPAKVAIQGDALGVYLSQHGGDFDRIFIEAGDCADWGVVRWLSGYCDKNVVAVDAGAAEKRLVDQWIERLLGIGKTPVGVMMVSGEDQAEPVSTPSSTPDLKLAWEGKQAYAG